MSTLVESPVDTVTVGMSSMQLAAVKPLNAMASKSLALQPRDKAQKEINVLLSVQKTDWPSTTGQTELIQVLAEETIKDVKLKLSNRAGWFTSKHCLVFGNRELLEHETVSQLLRTDDTAGQQQYLHIIVKLSDLENVEIVTQSNKELSAAVPGTPKTPTMKSALTTSLSENVATPQDNSKSLVPVSKAIAPLGNGSGDLASRTVVHLLVSKSAKVNWRHIKDDSFELSVSSSDTVETLKRRLSIVDANIELDQVDVVYGGQVLAPNQPLAQYGITKEAVLELVPVEHGQGKSLPDGSPVLSNPEHGLYNNWQMARAGLAHGHTPKLASAGTGGSYFLQDPSGANVAVFKPEDEEPLAVNNPKGLGTSPNGEGLRKGTRPGEGAVREVAAYLLDHDRFAGVPPTALVTCRVNDSVVRGGGAKVGSLQQFVVADSDCEERGPSAFPVPEVHKICILDIRLANTDRNGSNILACRDGDSWQLVPIDHGYCLPAKFEDISFEWMYWPQARQPFDAKSLAYIRQLDSERDVDVLRAHGLTLRPDCIRVLRVCTMLLKKAAAKGLTPYQIGCIMTRQGFGTGMSPLEKLHSEAAKRAGRASVRAPSMHSVMGAARGLGGVASGHFDERVYLRAMSDLLDQLLEEEMLDFEELLL